jgi:hypothetical protein
LELPHTGQVVGESGRLFIFLARSFRTPELMLTGAEMFAAWGLLDARLSHAAVLDYVFYENY